MAKTGRPEAEIDWKKVDDYLKAHCNGTGIAGLLGVAPITLYRACKRKYKVTFDAYSQQKQAEGKEILRSTQFALAVEKNVPMLIFLGKQYLGQTDKQEMKIAGLDKIEIKYTNDGD